MFEGESELKEELMQVVGALHLHQGIEDRLVWEVSSDRAFTVKSTYATQLVRGQQVNGGVFKRIRSIAAPSNIQAFIWWVMWDRIQTKVNLKQRNIV